MKRLLPLMIFILVCFGVLLLRRPPAPSGADTAAVPQTSASQPQPQDDSNRAVLSRLSVETQPAGATVLLNGRLAGATPILVDQLPLGVYGIRLEREGCQPVSFRVDLGAYGAALTRKLEPLPTGALVVDVLPHGAEVLLDGEWVGQTPLKLDRLPAGAYDLLIRKTNFKTYATRTEIAPGATQTYSGIELGDRVLEMLEGTQRAEPQRVSHYIDLAHYYFINDNLDKAVDAFARAMEVNRSSLNFDGPGYPGRARMTDSERAFEVQMRREDEERLGKEIEKHKHLGSDDARREFARKIEQAEDQANVVNPSWEYASRKADVNIGNGNYDKAERIYTDFIAAAEHNASQPVEHDNLQTHAAQIDSIVDTPKVYVALMELYSKKKDLRKLSETFDVFYKANASNAAALRYCGGALLKRPLASVANSAGRQRVLEMAQTALSHAVEITFDKEVKAQCQLDLGLALLQLSKFDEAVQQYQASVDATDVAAVREERSMSLATALRRAGRNDECRAICEKLLTSANARLRVRADVELQALQNSHDPQNPAEKK